MFSISTFLSWHVMSYFGTYISQSQSQMNGTKIINGSLSSPRREKQSRKTITIIIKHCEGHHSQVEIVYVLFIILIIFPKSNKKMGQKGPCACIAPKSAYLDSAPRSPTMKRHNFQKTKQFSERKDKDVNSPRTQVFSPDCVPNHAFKMKGRTNTLSTQDSKFRRGSVSHLDTEDRSRGELKTCLDSFTINHVLGNGGFGKVYLGKMEGKCQGQSRMYAIKQMAKAKIHQKNLVDNILLQKRIMKELKCNFIARSHYSFRDNNFYYIAMEWAQGGDVFSFIRPSSSRRELFLEAGEEAIRFILGCVIMGLEQLHSKNIVYSDMKPENLLIFQDGYIKLSDFGLSQQLEKYSHYYTRIGTMMFFAPEMALGDQCRRYVDLWALGVLAYELANLSFPFCSNSINDPKRFVKDVIKGEKQRQWDNPNVSQELKSFINSLLKYEPRTRLGASGWNRIKTHPFFAGFDWEALQKKQMISPLFPILEDKLEYQKVDPLHIKPEFCDFEDEDRELTIEGWTSNCTSHYVQ